MEQGKSVSRMHRYYGLDAARYDFEHKLKIKRIFEMIPSTLENKKKRVVVKEYPDNEDVREALSAAGFIREMQDYVLYR